MALDEKIDEYRNERVLTLSKLKSYDFCPHKSYLEEFVGYQRTPLSLRAAAGRFFKNKRLKLLEVRDDRRVPFPRKQRRAGRNLLDVEQMTAKELMEHMPTSSPEAYGAQLAARFSFVMDKQRYAGRDLSMMFKGEEGIIRRDLQRAGENYVNFLLKELAPVIAHLDSTTYFDVEGIRLGINLGELRPRTIDEKFYIFADYPTMSGFSPEAGESINTSNLVTLALMGITNLLTYELAQIQLGMPEAMRKHLEKNPDELSPRLIYRHIRLGGENTEINGVDRTNRDIDSAKELIANYSESVEKLRFEPNRKKCGSCYLSMLGVDGRSICSETSAKRMSQSYMGILKPEKYEVYVDETESGLEIQVNASIEFQNHRSTTEMARQTITIEEDQVTLDFEPTHFQKTHSNPHYELPFKKAYIASIKALKERMPKGFRVTMPTPKTEGAIKYLKKKKFKETEDSMTRAF